MGRFHKILCILLILCMMLPMIVACKDGQDGKDGTVVSIGENGNWFLDGVDTGISAAGAMGATGATGAQGLQGEKGDTGATGAQGPQGVKGDTGATGAQGPQGVKGDTGATGAQGPQGVKGEPGKNGTVVTILNGYWYLDGQPTGVKAEGHDGAIDTVVTIGANGNWYLDGVDSGVSALGVKGEPGKDGTKFTIGKNGNWFLNGVDTGISATESDIPRDTYSHVVLVGVDGGGAWFDDAAMPNVDRIFANGATTNTCIASAPTISAQCWGSILTGVDPVLHGMTNDKAKANAAYTSTDYPTIFGLTQASDPNASLAVFASWAGIKGLTEDTGVHREFTPGNDDKVAKDHQTANAAAAYIGANKPTLTFVQLDLADIQGENYGFGGAEHLAALAEVDVMIGNIYQAIVDAGIAEDTLFIVTADHGGAGNSHGGSSAMEYNVFCGFAGKTVMNNNALSMYQRDVAAAVCWALDAEGNDKWDSFVPTKLFADNKIPVQRAPKPANYLRPLTTTPAAGTPGYLGNYMDLSTLKAGLFFDKSLAELTGNSTATAGGSVTYESGFYGQATHLDKEDYVSVSDVTFGTDSFSIALWFKPDASNGTGGMVVYGAKDWESGKNPGFNFNWSNRGALWFNISNGSKRLDMKVGVESNHNYNWMHTLLTVNKETGDVTIYVNFVPVKSMKIGADMAQSLDVGFPFVLGADGNGKYGVSAVMDDLLIFDGALTDAQIAALQAYYSGSEIYTPAGGEEPGNMADYVNMDKLRAGLTFDDLTTNDIVGTHATTTQGSPIYTDGYYGAALRTSVGNHVSYDDLKFGKDSFAIAMWVKPDFQGSGDYPCIFGNKDWYSGYTNGFIVEFKDGQLWFCSGRGTNKTDGKDNRTNFKYELTNYNKEWIHILYMVERTATKDTVKLYVNFKFAGEMEMAAGTVGYDLDGAGVFTLGDDGVHTNAVPNTLCGSIDDFLLFNDVLTDEEIINLRNYYAQ